MGVKHATLSTAPGLVGATQWDEDHVVEGQFDLPLQATPVAPSADIISLFGRKIAGRMMPAFMGPSGLDSAVQPLLGRNKIVWANPVAGTATVSVLGIALTATGTATLAAIAATNIHNAMARLEYAVTTAAATAVAGWRSGVNQFFINGPSNKFGGFFYVCRFGRSRGVAANATLRGFTGFGSITSAPSDVDPSTGVTNILGVGCDAADTNYQIMFRNGTGTTTKVNTGIPKAVADTTEMYELAMFNPPFSSDVLVQFTRLSDDTTFTYVITGSGKPADGLVLSPRGYYSVGGTSAVIGYALASLYIEKDY